MYPSHVRGLCVALGGRGRNVAGGGGAGGPVLGALVWAVVVPLVEWSVLWRAL